jgi:aminoglycoside phosphotransferase (APT) family kinase protein
MTEKERWWFNHNFHRTLENVIAREFEITPRYSSLHSWGYSTTAYYVETKNPSRNYVVRLTPFSEERKMRIKKDNEMAMYLRDKLPIPAILPNKYGEGFSFIEREVDSRGIVMLENSFLRLSEHAQGALPVELTEDIYRQLLELLNNIHAIPCENLGLGALDAISGSTGPGVLLHGDLTPMNVLVYNDKVVAVFDFEEACVGPVEWDVAKTLVFSWFRLPRRSFTEMLEMTRRFYSRDVSPDLILTFARKHIGDRLKDIIDHKDSHNDQYFWDSDYNFTQGKLVELEGA